MAATSASGRSMKTILPRELVGMMFGFCYWQYELDKFMDEIPEEHSDLADMLRNSNCKCNDCSHIITLDPVPDCTAHRQTLLVSRQLK